MVKYIGYIYKITNTVNNKCYIGQTIKSIEFRFKEHIRRALKHSDHRSHLGAAIRYYGEDAFIIEEIFKVVAYSLETRFVLLDTMECFYIRKFNSRDLNLGYNIQPGGQYRNTKAPEMVQVYFNRFKYPPTCSVEGCSNPHLANGLCQKHYSQVYDHGSVQLRTSRDYNEILYTKDFAEIVLYNAQNKECGRTKVDVEDIPKLEHLKWHLSQSTRGLTVANNNKVGKLHTFIMSPPKDSVILHINGDGLDNRKSNLKIASKSEQQQKAPLQSNNKSGHKGVWFCKDRNKWQAQITINHKTKSLGRFNTFEEAVIAREHAEQQYYT